MLAHHKRPVPVTANGITLRFGKQVFNYRNIETSKLRGQKVLAWFNPELPEILTVTDMRRSNPFCVARSQDVAAMEAPADVLAQEQDRIEQHQAYPKARYRVLKARYAPQYRRMVADHETTELGAQIGAQRSALETAIRETDKQQTRGRQFARKLNMAIPSGRVMSPERISASKELAELLSDVETPTPKTEEGLL